ncbi:hypothetical protein [Nonomuraea sp. NPDC001699]
MRYSARVLQPQGLFDVPVSEKLASSWSVNLSIEERPWNVGLLVGPSGSGKSTIARRLWPDALVGAQEWSDRALVDDFPTAMSIKDVVGLLSAVGPNSPPAWLGPYATLSNGEAFRAGLARALAESRDLVVIDEFTSVVDRQVARIASHAPQKAVRRRKRQLVAVTCHYDVEDWPQPDWTYDVAASSFTWRSVQPRPALQLTIHHASARTPSTTPEAGPPERSTSPRWVPRPRRRKSVSRTAGALVGEVARCAPCARAPKRTVSAYRRQPRPPVRRGKRARR